MSSYFDKLNLRPQERRLIVGILVVIFIVLNVLLVWPKFGAWAKTRAALENAQRDLFNFQRKIAQAQGPNGFEAQLKKLEGESQGESVVADEQQIQLFRTVQSKVMENKVSVSNYGKVTESNNLQSTNEFFQEQSIPITVNTGEKELVDFLLDIGSGSSMIRVRDMNLRPADQNRYRLQGTITLSANYQKKPAPKAAAPATTKSSTTTSKPAAKPAVAAPQSKPATKPATVPTPPATTPNKTIPSPVRKP
jgi:Tfp pilus assembly protein PilO